MKNLNPKHIIIFLIICCFTSNNNIFSQENLTYQIPSKEIYQLADYERAPSVIMDTKKEYMMLMYRNTYKTLEDLNQDELRLGGLRINPVTNISSTLNYINNIKVRKVKAKEEQQVQGLPENPRLSNFLWSIDEKKIAFTNTTATGVELWVLFIETAKAVKLTTPTINANMGAPMSWFSDNENILVRMLPQNRPALIDASKDLPKGPIISVSTGEVSQNRTYQDLLKNPTDEINFENISSSELHKVNITSSRSELFKSKDLYVSESFSPDGKYLMLVTLQKPFSYLVPYSRFPMKAVVYDAKGNEVKVVNEIPLAEILPKGFMAVRKGKRNMAWRNDLPATLYYVEALDEGNPENKVEFRDELFQWAAPFTHPPVSLTKIIQRFSSIIWGNSTVAILYDNWYDTRNTKTYIFNPSSPNQPAKIIWDRNSQDVYSDPGDFQTIKNQYGRRVLVIDNGNAILIGKGHSPAGQFPFIDRFDLKRHKSTRLYKSTYTDKLENIIELLDANKGEVLVRIESKTDYPNFYFLNFKNRNQLTQLTAFKNPFQSIENVHKEVIKYKRKDGVELSGTLYLPAGYDKKEKLPLLIWAYPTEFKDKSSAGQSTANPNEFTFPYYGSFVYWVVKGYAVLDDASFPIVGEGSTEPNDTFIEQLIANAEAAIDAVDGLGYIDRTRVGVGGHSYGAFMTANLLTHSNLFACGIARSGAYNRTLTPFGFQTEQRNYWEAKEVYDAMSPFMSAEKMKIPMLLVHGEADNNPGTFTLQTERYFQALKGLGAPVRLLLLPKESHSYHAKDNIFHLLWEQEQFLDKHLKNK